MIKTTITTLALTLTTGCAFAGGLPKTAKQVDKKAAEMGAKTFLDSLNEGQLDKLYSRIKNGASDWVALAPKLAEGADAANAEGLPIVLAYALPKNPAAVLSVITDDDGLISAKKVCSMPFIEDTASHLAAYKKQTLRKLASQTDPSLLKAKANCEGILKATATTLTKTQ